MKALKIVWIIVLVVLMTGCKDEDASFTIVGNRNERVTVGDVVPDLLEGVTIVTSKEGTEYVLEVDASDVDTSLAGTYDITYYIELDGVRLYEESNTFTVVEVYVSPYPEISGVDEITYVIGEELPDYLEGVSALDQEFGDLTPYVSVTNNVQYDTLGTYEVQYTVMNNAGYTDTVSSLVHVTGGDLYQDLPDDFFLVRTHEKWGITDTNNEFIVPAEYDGISYLKESIIRLQQGETMIYYDFENNEYFQSEHVIYGLYYNGLGIAMDREGYLGYVDTRGEVVIPFIFDGAGPFDEDGAIVTMGENTGMIDEFGNAIIDVIYEGFIPFGNNLYKAIIGNETFLFDSTGVEILQCASIMNSVVFDDETYFYYSDSPTSETTGLLNLSGEVVVPSVYQGLSYIGVNVKAYDSNAANYDIYNVVSGNIVYDIDAINTWDDNVVIDRGVLRGMYDLETLDERMPIEYRGIYKTLDAWRVCGEDNYCGLMDRNFVITVPLVYDFHTGSKVGRYIFTDGEGAHMFTEDGTEVTQSDYSDIWYSDSTGYFKFRDELGYVGFMNLDGVEVLPGTYYSISEYDEYGYAYTRTSASQTASNAGVMDRDFNEVLPNEYYTIYMYSEGSFAVKLSSTDDTSSGHVDETNSIVTPLIYYHAWPFANGVSTIQVTYNEFNFADETGNLISTMNYSQIRMFNESGLGAVKTTALDASWCVINMEGDLIGSCTYISIGSFNDGLATVVRSNGFHNYIKEDGTLLDDRRYVYTDDFDSGVGVVTMDYAEHAINTEGEYIITNKDAIFVSYDGNSILVIDDGYYGYYNLDGTPIFKEQYQDVSQMVYGYVLACEIYGMGCGFITDQNETIIPHRYMLYEFINQYKMKISIDNEIYDIEITEEGLYKKIYNDNKIFMNALYNDGLWSLYDMDDNLIGQYEVDDIREWNEEYLLYEMDGRFGYIIIETGEMTDAYHQVNYSEIPFWIVWDKGSVGLISRDGTVIIEPIYDMVSYYDSESDYIRTGKGAFEGIYTIEGIMILPIEYDHVQIEKK